MLAGWSGHGQALETTQGIVARHIGKSVSTVQRMLLDTIIVSRLAVLFGSSLLF